MCDSATMAELFADGFCSVYDDSIPVVSAEHQVCLSTMDPVSITYDAVFYWLKQLDTGKCPGPDGVHPRLLKECASELASESYVCLL